MSRARGANAKMAGVFEAAYGVPPTSGYFQLPFVSSNLGDEQGLIASDLLGYGRDPQQPARDVVNNRGDVVVPLDARNFGFWLKLLLGAPTTSTGVAATGSYTFSDQPAASATITVGGQAFTFVASNPTANQILIGATLAETVANAVVALNASTVAGVAVASYAASLDGTKILITYDTLGTAGNAMTLAAGGTSNATPSAATLTGGAASGPKHHVFVSGKASHPSASIEVGLPEVPSFGMNYGVMAASMGIQLQRSGLLNATVALVAQGETRAAATAAGTPSEMVIDRFSQFSGQVSRDGVPLAHLISGQFNLDNGLDVDESIRGDGRIGGADPAMLAVTGQIGVRYANDTLRDIAENGQAIELAFEWSISASQKLRIVVHNVYLPRAKQPITGPGGIQADYAWQGSEHPTLAKTCTVTLVNDVTSY